MSDAPTKIELAATARGLLRRVDAGILSTMSVELPGYPFGSVTPFVTTHEGRAAIYVSEIAQHTHNMRADAKVCLTVTEDGGPGNQQALGRVTVIGDAREVPAADEAAVAGRYFRFFPEARGYAGTHAFRFFWIEPVRVRYIGGFGRIFWVDPEDWILPTPEWAPDEDSIVAHMNDDHAASVVHIARQHGASDSDATLVALDSEGFHLRAGATVRYVPFSRVCTTSEDVRAAFIELSRAAADQV